ncbi:MAG: response regulator [gamma proteobacterium symbiont of Bathyaustriella thionipta]|nr:response regulator [gamma proteobacterium symbiont of Bathyaustriella thionipta]MCU7951276.1 response regulator [gamma proteobacterium symbiont of Bathyaustriella thionipta]MCU7952362.1 response regulator [gamma proteobacterium symbiont of Bathyaustriella thionipta]MCU7957808.1 response regulator [gamma proteobacterium symbiont of Bathyaustriella thionipta]MCU7968513.1 response regulator [gamma proteobacterium symbiont of Bathyaustriella thionipta]
MNNQLKTNNGEILVVDDTHANLKLLMDMLTSNDYKVRPALDGEQALAAVAMRCPDLILLDIKMPGIDGYEVCRRLKNDVRTQEIPVIFISALDALGDRVKGFELGAVDYITKPFQREEVLVRVHTHMQLRKMQINLEDLVDKRTEQLQQSTIKMRSVLIQMIKAFSVTVEKRDPYTAGHQQRVADLAVAIAQEMALHEDMIEGIRLGTLIHDIGKIYVPAEFLNRPGKLTELEFQIIKIHPEAGYEIVRDVEFPWPVADMIYQHHERADGSGYPRGLIGDEIIQEARIIAVADVVEAIASHRPYRASLGTDFALQEIEKNRGVLFDPYVVDACVKLFREKHFNLT